jgi:hypothetical protein
MRPTRETREESCSLASTKEGQPACLCAGEWVTDTPGPGVL